MTKRDKKLLIFIIIVVILTLIIIETGEYLKESRKESKIDNLNKEINKFSLSKDSVQNLLDSLKKTEKFQSKDEKNKTESFRIKIKDDFENKKTYLLKQLDSLQKEN